MGSRNKFSETKVKDLGVAAAGHEDIGGFDVAMDNALGVGSVERIRDFDGELQQKVGLERLAGDAVLQGEAVQVFHDDEGLAVLLVDLVDGADVGMIQGRGGAGFALKSFKGLSIRCNLFGEKLESDEASELDVLSFVDDTHAAAAKFFDDAIVRDDLIDHSSLPACRVAPYYGRSIRSSTKRRFCREC